MTVRLGAYVALATGQATQSLRYTVEILKLVY
jgi:hypothetical protein